MRNRLWKVGLSVLVGLLLYSLVQLTISSIQIERLTYKTEMENDIQGVHVIIIAQELDNPFWRLVEAGAREASQQLDVQIDYIGPQRNDRNEQIRLLEKAIAASPKGIVIQGIADERYEQMINKATQQGITVITVDADMPESERVAYVGTNQWEAGQQLGQAIIDAGEKEHYIGIIMGTNEANNQQIRLQGLTDKLHQHSHLKIVHVATSNISRIEAARQTIAMLRRHPQITTMVGLSSLDAAGIVDGIESMKQRKPISVYGFDRLDVTLQYIKEGKIQATIAQNPEQMGIDAVEAIVDYLAGEPIQSEQFIPTKALSHKEIVIE